MTASAAPIAAAPPLPTLRATRPEDYPQIQKLEAAHGLLTLSEPDWRRMWRDNPLLRDRPDWPIGWVLEEQGTGQIVGSLANIPTAYLLDGKSLVAATGRAWVVSEAYRGVALWLMDEYFNQDGVDLFINTTVNSMAVDPFSAFGSKRVPRGDWETAAFCITNHVGFARAALRIKRIAAPKLLAWPAGAALAVKDALSAKPRPVRRIPAGEVAFADGFDGRFDAFWQELVRQRPRTLLADRQSPTLAWHFRGPLEAGQAWIITASHAGVLRSYAIFKRQDHPPSGLLRMRLVDFQSLEPDGGGLSAILDLALRRCRAERLHLLEHVGVGLPRMEAFDAVAPYRRKLPAWPFYYMTPDAELSEKLSKPQTWEPSTYDGDASL